jgi:hypothetical protein
MFQPEVDRVEQGAGGGFFGGFWWFLALFGHQSNWKNFFDFGLVFFIFIMADVSARNS